MAKQTVSLHDWITDSLTNSLWRQPFGTKQTTTETYERFIKRLDKRIIEDVVSHAGFHDEVTKLNIKVNEERRNLFNKIVERIKKSFPEMKTIQARNYARKKDPIGRKFQSLYNQRYTAEEIGYDYKTDKFTVSKTYSRD